MEEEQQTDNDQTDKCMLENKPNWWERNEEIREQLGIGDLGSYDPPQFSDGTYTHEIIPLLEQEYGCSIRIVSINPHTTGTWEIRINGIKAVSTHRHRDRNGNSIYEIDSETVVTVVEGALSE